MKIDENVGGYWLTLTNSQSSPTKARVIHVNDDTVLRFHGKCFPYLLYCTLQLKLSQEINEKAKLPCNKTCWLISERFQMAFLRQIIMTSDSIIIYVDQSIGP